MTYSRISIENAPFYKWGNSCDSWILAYTPGLSVKLESLPPDTREKLHFHAKAQQFFFILKGTATFYVDDNMEVLSEHNGILVTAETRHYIANQSSTELRFLVISQPAINSDRINIED